MRGRLKHKTQYSRVGVLLYSLCGCYQTLLYTHNVLRIDQCVHSISFWVNVTWPNHYRCQISQRKELLGKNLSIYNSLCIQLIFYKEVNKGAYYLQIQTKIVYLFENKRNYRSFWRNKRHVIVSTGDLFQDVLNNLFTI